MKNILLFGSGYMAEQYLKVLQAIGSCTQVVGRDEAKAKTLASRYGAKGLGGGIKALEHLDVEKTDLTIIAISAESLKEVTLACIARGIRNILVEKPGAVDSLGLQQIKSALLPGMRYRVAYNRRFYNSVLMLKERIAVEKVLGCSFEFTEREKGILTWDKPAHLLSRLGFMNSTHVIDTAFYLMGAPVSMVSLRDGSIAGHPSGSVFSGCGRTERCLFCYMATWGGGGRWQIEISTSKGKYRLCPLEELWFCKKDTYAWEKIEAHDDDDTNFKPGLYKMVAHALSATNTPSLPGIDEQITTCKTVDKIFYYEN